MNKKTFYITTPIYYPSGNLHIGHVYTTTLAWTLANYKKMMGYDVKMLTGADEHGQKIEEKARENNIDPQQYVDKMSNKFQELWKLLEIDYDYFSRTSNKQHMESVTKQFSQLYKQGDIYKGSYKGLYSISDEEFFTKTQAIEKEGKFYHPISGHMLKEIEEESYFFKISKYQKWLKEYFENNPNFIFPTKIIKELMNNFIDKGLEDLSVTRSTFNWGININEDKKHIIYVWLDALNNYITALGYNSNNDLDFQKYWVNGDEIVHIIGKEITRFHGIYWPIILKSLNIKLPTKIISHGWIITQEGKMSKSKGNVIDPILLINKYGPEVLKYFFASQMNISQDGVFDEEILKNVYNSELANNFGNLISRTIAMTLQNFNKPIQHITPTTKDDEEVLEYIKIQYNKFQKELNNYQINNGLKQVVKLGKKLNGYIDITKPWTLKENKQRLSEILNNLLNGIYAIATMLSIVMPNKSKEIFSYLNLKNNDIFLILDFNKFDKTLPIQGKVLFERIK